MIDTEQIWKRRPDEPEKAWAAFRVWLTLPTRTGPELARYGFNPSSIEKWRQRYDWAERTLAFDNAEPVEKEAQQPVLKSLAPVTVDHKTTITVNEMGDFSMMLFMWRKLFEAISDNLNLDSEQAILERVNALNKMLGIRMQLSDLGRRAARMPKDYGLLRTPDETDPNEGSVIELTPDGPKYIEDTSDGENTLT